MALNSLEQTYCTETSEGLGNYTKSPDERIDSKNCIAKCVKILGLNSKNPAYVLGVYSSDYDSVGNQFGEAANFPYSYEMDGVRAAIPLYEGSKIFLNHTSFNVDENGKRTLSNQDNRRADDLFGWLTNVHAVEGEGLFGDLNYIKNHPFAERFIEIAKRNPSIIGLSHEALLDEPRLNNGKVTIPGIKHVQRVALISEQPGTTAGLFESAITPVIKVKTVKKTIRKVYESAKPEYKGYEAIGSLIALIDKKIKPTFGIVSEMSDDDYGSMMGGMDSEEMDMEDDTDPEDALCDAMIKVICKLIETSNSGQLKKILSALGLSDSIAETLGGPSELEHSLEAKPEDKPVEPKPEDKPPEKPADTEPKDTEKEDKKVAEENKVIDKSNYIFECMAILRTEGAVDFASDPIVLKAMTSLSAEDRVTYAKSLAAKKPEDKPEYVPQPRSAGVPVATAPVAAEGAIDWSKPDTMAEFFLS